MDQKTQNLKTINTGLYIGAIITLLIAAGAYFVANGNESIGYIILGASLFLSLLFLFFFIPQGQRLEISDKAITFYAYKYCRAYFWNQIKAIELNENVIIKIANPNTEKQDEKESLFEVTVNAEVYGYTPKELYELLNKKLIEQKI